MIKEKIKFKEFTRILNSTFDDLLNNPQSNSIDLFFGTIFRKKYRSYRLSN